MRQTPLWSSPPEALGWLPATSPRRQPTSSVTNSSTAWPNACAPSASSRLPWQRSAAASAASPVSATPPRSSLICRALPLAPPPRSAPSCPCYPTRSISSPAARDIEKQRDNEPKPGAPHSAFEMIIIKFLEPPVLGYKRLTRAAWHGLHFRCG